MTETTAVAGPGQKKRSKGLLIAAVLALILGGSAFFGVYSGLVPLPFLSGDAHDPEAGPDLADAAHEAAEPIESPGAMTGPPPAYVLLDTMIVSLDPQASARHLRVSVQVEVDPAQADAVTSLKPRLADVLNTFLRAVEAETLARPRSMARLRAQMLRRIQLVTPPDSVRDLLIQEFVLN